MLKKILFVTIFTGLSFNALSEDSSPILKSEIPSISSVQMVSKPGPVLPATKGSDKNSTEVSLEMKDIHKSDEKKEVIKKEVIKKEVIKKEEVKKEDIQPQVKDTKYESGDGELTAQMKVDNDYIRNVFNNFSIALNTDNIKKLKEVTTEHFIVIGDTQELYSNKNTIGEYFPKMVGTGKFERLNLSLDSGFTLNISKDGYWGTVYGKGVEKYKLNGSEYSVPLRVTAVVVKDSGEWKINSLHLGVNFADNPILTGFEKLGNKFLLIGFILGILISIVLGVIFLKKKC